MKATTENQYAIAAKEIDRLADFVLKNMPEEIGKGDPRNGESAVDVAIRLLGRLKKCEDCRGFELMMTNPLPGIND